MLVGRSTPAATAATGREWHWRLVCWQRSRRETQGKDGENEERVGKQERDSVRKEKAAGVACRRRPGQLPFHGSAPYISLVGTAAAAAADAAAMLLAVHWSPLLVPRAPLSKRLIFRPAAHLWPPPLVVGLRKEQFQGGGGEISRRGRSKGDTRGAPRASVCCLREKTERARETGRGDHQPT